MKRRHILSAASPIALLVCSLGLSSEPARAATSCTLSAPTVWSAGGDGSWEQGTSWSGGATPNGAGINTCITDGTSKVTRDTNATVGSLQIAHGNTLSGARGTSFTITGPQFINAGNADFNAGAGSNSILAFGGNTSLSGGGTVTLNPGDGNGAMFVRGNGFTLSNMDNLIQGSGNIGDDGLAVVNHGTINANNSTQPLTLNAGNGGVTNTGTLEASNGGTLNLSNTTANTGGTITGDAGTVNLTGKVLGGTLSTANGGTVQTGGTVLLDTVTISAGSTYTAGLGTNTSLNGGLTNKGLLQLNAGAGSNAVLTLGTDGTLSGGGTVTLNPGDGNGAVFIHGNGYKLTNKDNLIQGSGNIGDDGLAVVNNATIVANNPVQVLNLNGGNGGLSNTGLLEATNGATLNLYNSIGNDGATITADGGAVSIAGTITGGTLNTFHKGTMATSGSATLDHVVLSSGSTYTGGLGTTTTLANDFVNGGLVQLNAGSGSIAILTMGTDVKLSGGGTVTLNPGDGNGAVYLRGNGHTLTNVDNLIQGSGFIGDDGLAVVNKTKIIANNATQALDLNAGNGGLTNMGLLEATNGAALHLHNSIANTGATITADNGAVTIVGTITGGTLNTVNGGTMATSGSATLDSVVLSTGSTYTAGLGTNTTLANSFTNNGLLQLNAGAGSVAILNLSTDIQLAGGGTVTLNPGDGNGAVYLRGNGHTLTNVDNLIQGSGFIGDDGLAVVNKTKIIANNATQALDLNAGNGGVTNLGLLEATNGAALRLHNSIANTGATITADNGAVTIAGTITGGTLNTVNGGTMATNGSATLDSVTLSAGTTYASGLGSVTTLLNSFTNQGALQLHAGAGSNMLLIAGSDLLLSGGGTVTMDPGDGNGAVYIRGNGHTLTNQDNLIQGAGFIGDDGLTVVNKSTIIANNSVQALDLNAGNGGLTNLGLLEATNGATLSLHDAITNTGATITANNGAMTLAGTITGGTLNTLNGGTMATNGTAALDSVTLSTGSTYSGGLGTTTTLLNTLTNKGTLQFNAGAGRNTFVRIGSDLQLTGGGKVTLNPGDGNGSVYLRGNGYTLTNVDNLIQGSGFIGDEGLNFVNGAHGTLFANQSVGSLSVSTGGGSFINNGLVKVAAGSSLVVGGGSGGFVQSQGATSAPLTQVEGTLTASNGMNIQAGILEGNGTVIGNVLNAATVHPGDSPGILSIQGNYTQQSSGDLAFTLAGTTPGTEYSQLKLSGIAALDGKLSVSLANGFALTTDDIFTLIMFGSSTGDFAGFDFNGHACSSGGADLWSCGGGGSKTAFKEIVSNDQLQLTVASVSAVPLPGGLSMFGGAFLALAGLGRAVSGRRKDKPVSGRIAT